LSALVSQPVIPPVSISLPPQGNIEAGLPAQVDTSEIKSAGPKLLKSQIFVSLFTPDQTSFYIQYKITADNIKIGKI